jgi:hypothetical protein
MPSEAKPGAMWVPGFFVSALFSHQRMLSGSFPRTLREAGQDSDVRLTQRKALPPRIVSIAADDWNGRGAKERKVEPAPVAQRTRTEESAGSLRAETYFLSGPYLTLMQALACWATLAP